MIKVIEKEEADAIYHLSGSRESLVSSLLKQLEIGKAITIPKADWHAKMPPSTTARNLEKRTPLRFRTGRLPDNSGWILQRIA